MAAPARPHRSPPSGLREHCRSAPRRAGSAAPPPVRASAGRRSILAVPPLLRVGV